MNLGAGMGALRYSCEIVRSCFVYGYVSHLQDIFIQIHHSRITEEQIEVF